MCPNVGASFCLCPHCLSGRDAKQEECKEVLRIHEDQADKTEPRMQDVLCLKFGVAWLPLKDIFNKTLADT